MTQTIDKFFATLDVGFTGFIFFVAAILVLLFSPLWVPLYLLGLLIQAVKRYL